MAFYELFLRSGKNRYWIHEFTSTTTSATERITAVRRGRQVWTPPAAGIALQPFADTPPPAADDAPPPEPSGGEDDWGEDDWGDSDDSGW